MIVKQTRGFTRNGDERMASAWLSLASGPNLRCLIDIYNITTTDEDRPFSGLLDAIWKFDQMTDATIEYCRLIASKGQSVTSFFEQYIEMVEGIDPTEREIQKKNFVLKLRDEKLKEHAAAFDLEPEAVVMTEMRKELLSEATMSSNPPAVVTAVAAPQEGGSMPSGRKSCLTYGKLGDFAKVDKNGNRNDHRGNNRRTNGSDEILALETTNKGRETAKGPKDLVDRSVPTSPAIASTLQD
jgi:hypothetical protein